MFAPITLKATSSQKRKWLNTILITICAFFIWISPTDTLIKLFLTFILFSYFSWLLFKERDTLEIEWKLLDDIQITSKNSKSSYKLSSCIITSWYCVWVLTSENGRYKKLHLWFDQFDEQTRWQLRCNLAAWKQNST